MNASSIEHREKTAQYLWTGFILLFFVIQAIIWAIAITYTANDKSHAVVAGYDEQQSNWNDQVAARADSAKTGWQFELNVDPAGDIRKHHPLQLRLADSGNQPVSGARLQLEAFHVGRAGEPQTLELQETQRGVYSGSLKLGRNGHWQFTGAATRGKARFLIDERQYLTATGK